MRNDKMTADRIHTVRVVPIGSSLECQTRGEAESGEDAQGRTHSNAVYDFVKWCSVVILKVVDVFVVWDLDIVVVVHDGVGKEGPECRKYRSKYLSALCTGRERENGQIRQTVF